MTIPVVRLAPGNQWDQVLLDDLISGAFYPHGLEFEGLDAYPAEAAGILLVIPGRYYASHTAAITEAISRYRWVLAFRVGDEEDLFDIAAVKHPNIRWWIQTPRVGKDYGTARFLPLGYTPHFAALPAQSPEKSLDVFLSAQCTHARRAQAFDALARVPRSKRVRATGGFTQGMPAEEYAEFMAAARIAPAPSGAVSPDSFRAYEALEAHTIPIVDDISPAYDSRGYWERMFPGSPMPVIRDYDDLPGWIDDVVADYPRLANRITAWWMATKRRMAAALREDLIDLGVSLTDSRQPITVLVTCSPIRSHPRTVILEETIASVRAQLPDAEIVLTFDGVRAEQEDRRVDYEQFILRALWLADHQWRNVLPIIHDEHLHQAVCAKRALEHVQTPLLLFVEHDTPVTGDIPWVDISETILAGDANVLRLHHEASVLEPHRYLMLDDQPQKVRGVPMQRTIQWSQRPHLASVAWYRSLLDRWFPGDEKDFIEDRVYGRLIEDHKRDGDMGWLGWRTWIYTPDGNIQRSYHSDGRAGEDKFDG